MISMYPNRKCSEHSGNVFSNFSPWRIDEKVKLSPAIVLVDFLTLKTIFVKMEKQKTEDDLTIEKLKTFEGFETVTDEQAENIILFLDELADILCLRIAEMEHEEIGNNTNTGLTKNKAA